jgi:hypothetical protein
MSKSQIACTINTTECAVVRLKTSGITGYSLTACKTLPFGLGDLASGKGKRLLNKLGRHLKEWQNEDLALCVDPETYLPLPAYFPADASQEECKEYCRIEAGYFLTQPENYRYELTRYCDNTNGESEVNRLLIFYPDERCRTVSEHFSVNHQIVFIGSPQRPLVYLSKFTGDPQVILELEKNSVLLTISKNGLLEKFSYHQVKSREEMEYFTIKVLTDNPICCKTEVQVTGIQADKVMIALIGKKTSINLTRLNIPTSIPITNPQQFSLSSAAVVTAISTALMALYEKREPTTFSH